MITVIPEVRQIVIDFQQAGGPHMIAIGQKTFYDDSDGSTNVGPLREVRESVVGVGTVDTFLAWALTKLNQKMDRTDIVYMTPPEE